jgi:Secretion system C-terminal sorting domain
MKNYIIIICTIFFSNNAIAQSALTAATKTINSNQLQHTYCIGEMCAVTTVHSKLVIVTQGTLQPNDNSNNQNQIDADGKIIAYPNPTVDIINFQIPITSLSSITIRMFDASGKVIIQMIKADVRQNANIPIDLQSFPSGIYTAHLLIQNESSQQKSSFIIKKIN